MVSVGGESLPARLVDSSEDGFGLCLQKPLEIGSRVRLKGQLLTGAGARAIEVDGMVRWSVPSRNGTHLTGVAVDHSSPAHGLVDSGEQDFYEVLQVSSNADSDTIHRIFRVLAQRFHPDNAETGDESWFKVLVRAYETLGDPQRRAAYDARRPAQQKARWKIFESAEAAKGVEAERRKRQSLLSLLYVRRANDFVNPSMTLHEFEQLLGCPREHLEFALWFLKENAWVARADNGRYAITAKGVERAEETGLTGVAREDRLLAAPGV